MKTPAYARTRSKRFRAGSRRNKHLQIVMCPEPKVCLVHTTRPTPPALRMRLTACEQRWVDDVRAGRIHAHTLKPLAPRQEMLFALRQRINNKRFADAGIINASSYDPRMPIDDMSDQGLMILEHTADTVAEALRFALVYGGDPRTTQQRVQAMVNERMSEPPNAEGRMQMGVDYGYRRRRMDISDWWYPRGE